MKRHWRAILVVIVLVSFGIAFSYPIIYKMQEESNSQGLEELARLREQILQEERVKENNPVNESGPEQSGPDSDEQKTGERDDLKGEEPDEKEPDEKERSGQEAASEDKAGEEPGVVEDIQKEENAEGQTGTSEEEETGAPGTAEGEAEEEETADNPADKETAGTADKEAAERTGKEPADTADTEAAGTADKETAETTDKEPADTADTEAAEDADTETEDIEAADAAAADKESGQEEVSKEEGAETEEAASGKEAADREKAGEVSLDSDEKASEDAEQEESKESEKPPQPKLEDLILDDIEISGWHLAIIPDYESEDTPELLRKREILGDRSVRIKANSYDAKEKVVLDEDKILPELKPIYELNSDLVGWLVIDGTSIDYPVVQSDDMDYYMDHDFYGDENLNGQIVLYKGCDPYTPSYNLIISGHHMRNGTMFSGLLNYKDKNYWDTHKYVQFDNLMERNRYVIFAAFASADYDENEDGFRYSWNIVDERDTADWLEEIDKNALYETGIDAKFGDEFITLTTCDRSRREDGRFVLVCRKLREGEAAE